MVDSQMTIIEHSYHPFWY